MPPPEAVHEWDGNNWWLQGLMIAYQQIREHDEQERFNLLLQCIMKSRVLF